LREQKLVAEKQLKQAHDKLEQALLERQQIGSAELINLFQEFRKDLIDEIEAACHRGADLTRNLLAYARKQPLRAEAVQLGNRVSRIELAHAVTAALRGIAQ